MEARGSSSRRSTRRAKGKLVALAPCKPRQKAKSVEGVTYPCPSCHLKFDNAQALGGHQNAHRKEREEEERRYRESTRAYASSTNVHGFVHGGMLQPLTWGCGGRYGFQQVSMGPNVAAGLPPVAAGEPRTFDFMGENGLMAADERSENEEVRGLDLDLHL